MHPCAMSLGDLTDYQDGRADDAVRARVAAHLRDGCPACERHLAWLAAMAEGIRQSGQMVSPSYSLEPARALYRERMQPQERTRWIARLVFDSRAAPAAAALRSSNQAAFQQLYATDEHDVDLWCEPQADGTWYVIGQALPREGEEVPLPGGAELQSEGGEARAATLDGSEFHFEALPAGTYRVRIRLPQGDVVVPGVRLEP